MKPIVLSNRWAKVKIYECRNNSRYVSYCVAWYEGRFRRRESISSLPDARKRAEEVLDGLSDGRASKDQKTDTDLFALVMKEQKAARLGVSLDEVLHFYEKNAPRTTLLPDLSVEEAKDRYYKALVEDDCRERHLETVKSNLGMLVKAFHCPIAAVTPDNLVAYLEGLKVQKGKRVGAPVSNRTFNNHLGSLHAFFNWAKEKHFVSQNPAEKIEPRKVETDGDPGIFTPGELEALLKISTESNIFPFLVIGAFAGVRANEIQRLDWSDIWWEDREIALKGKVTKVRKRRSAHMSDNLMAWLKPFRNHTGPIVPIKRPNRPIAKLVEKIGLTWKDNGLRHSFISYSMAIHRDAGKVAEQCGNSEEIVQRDYKAVVPRKEAEKWFAIFP